MNRCLLPEVRGNCYDIIFTPVLRSDDKLTDLAKQSLFIVEIRVRPLVVSSYFAASLCTVLTYLLHGTTAFEEL
jgi:hypothetical protein